MKRLGNILLNTLLAFLGVFIISFKYVNAQPMPAIEENIPYLVIFGSDSEKSWGDDDFCQIVFFLIPNDQTDPVYIRVFDPDIGGQLDEIKGEFDTEISYTVYGGNECWSDKDAQQIDPVGNYKSGTILASKKFKENERYDNKWYTFGPFNPLEGELVEKFGGRVFKMIVQGVSGNDGNLYKFFLSTQAAENKEVEGGNIFTYEYTFRLWNNSDYISQIYPYADEKTISIKISNFDWDDDGFIRIVSVAKNGLLTQVSGENEWVHKEFPILKEEQNTSIEIQFIKNKKRLIKNNNVVIIVQNQYGRSLPFFTVPIGGIPVYNPKINMKPIKKR